MGAVVIENRIKLKLITYLVKIQIPVTIFCDEFINIIFTLELGTRRNGFRTNICV